VSDQKRIWCRVGTLILIAFLDSACTSGTGLQPVPYHPGPTEVELTTPAMSEPARYSQPRLVSRYHYDGTEVDLATPLSRPNARH
jgi:hypothetical protein